MVIRWIVLTSLPLLAFANGWIDASDNGTISLDVRHPRVTGRIVKLYSGPRPEPFYCTHEGFQVDPRDCTLFYRCVSAKNGKYNVYRFQCGPGTVFDPETEVCNHPQNTKRSECGGRQPVEPVQPSQQSNENEIDEKQPELPSPISTRRPDFGGPGYTTQRAHSNSQSTATTAYPWPTAIVQQASATNKPNTGQSNSKNYPLCTTDGFMGDTDNCRTFYRCVSNMRGGYIRYEFQCSETTIWDDDAQSCNHAWAVQRSRCGRSNVGYNADKTFTLYPPTKTTKKDQTSTTPTKEEPSTTTSSDSSTQDPTSTTSSSTPGKQTPSTSLTKPTIQEQLQINYGTKVSQTQTQISHGPVIQNQTQINYGNSNNSNQDVKQNQTQVSKGSAVSQTQTQINYGDKAVQTQSQIDHTQQASQTQTSQSESSTTRKPTDEEDNEPDNGYNNQPDPEPSQPNTETSNSNGNMGTDCTESGFMGDPNDCKKFYRCVDNGKGGYTKYEFTCGEGTVWDASIEGCNHQWAVKNCGGKGPEESTNQGSSQTTTQPPKTTTTQKTTQKPTKEPTTTDDGDDYGDVGYGNQNPQPSQSPTTTAQPQKQTTITEATAPSGSSGTECSSSGFVGDEQDCKKFYRCVDNGRGSYTKYEFKCGEGTVWDPNTEACNHAWAVSKCGGSSTDVNKVETTTAKQTTAAPSAVPTTTQESGQDVDTDYDNGYGQPSNEPPQSSSLSTTTTTTKKPQSSSTGGNKCQESGFMGDENDCKKFYRCVDDGKGGFTRYEFTCGEGTAWDQSIEGCNHAELVSKCGGSGGDSTGSNTQSETTESPKDTTTEKVTKTTSKPSQTTTTSQTNVPQEPTKKPAPSKECEQEGFMGDPNDCKKFYRCVDNGKEGYTKYEFSCGDGTVWDPEINSCNHPSSDGQCRSGSPPGGDTNSNKPPNVESDEMVTEDGTTTTTTTTSTTPASELSGQDASQTKPPTESKAQCESEGFYAIPDDCTKFYRCVDNGKGGFTKYDFDCGDGTVWVQDIQTCDHDSEPSSCKKQTGSSVQSPSEQEQSTTESSTATTSSSPTSSSSATQPNQEQKPSEKPSSSGSPEECTSEGFYGNKEDCTKFYRCVDNGQGGFQRYDFDCGEGTAWDPDIQTCNHKGEVESCQNTGQTTSKPNQEQEQNRPQEQEQEQTKPVMQDEQPSQSSESTTSSSSGGSSEPPKDSQQSQSSSKATCDKEGYFGNPDDCKKFYRCVDNGNGGYTKYDFDCGEGTIWDQDITTCNHPQDVRNPSCKQSQSGSESNSDVSSTSSTLSTSSTTASSSPSQTTSSTTESSGSGSSNCSQENSSKKPANNGYDCPEAGYYADRNDCKKFYRCVDWDGDGKKFSIYHFECGEGTIWDPALDTCNHKESVYPPRDCSGSQSQGENQTQENTTEMSTTQEDNTTQQSTTEKSTTESPTSEESTAQEPMTSQPTTTEQGTTSEQTTTEHSTEKTTTKKSTTSDQTTTEQTTTQESTTQEQTEATTAQQTTTEKTTTQESTTQEQTEGTTAQPTTEQTTTQQSTTQESTEQTTQGSTTEQSGEPTTQESTTEQQSTTSQSSESTDQTTSGGGTTESGTTEGGTTEGGTTEGGTTEGGTTEGGNTEGGTTAGGTTEGTTESSGTTDSSTTESSSSGDKECPETEDDQNLFVCPTSFRRHPKYCNMFYQCTEDDDTHEVKIATFNCPNNTIYDENQTKCVEENKAEKKCDGEMAQKRRFKRLDAYYREPITITSERLRCPATGHFPFETEECSPAFLKCQRSKAGNMRGQVYRCPESYVYWAVSRRCEPKLKMRDCKHTLNDWKDRWEIPIERRNVAPRSYKY